MSFDVSHVKTASVAISAAILFAIGSPSFAPASTKEELSRCRAIRHYIARQDCFESLKEVPIPMARPEGAPNAKTGNTPSPPATDDPATTSSIDYLSAIPGRPLCADRDALAAMLVAGVLASSPTEATTTGCETVPDDAQIEILERYPSGLDFLRVIKVKVTSPTQSDSTVGYTVEIGH